MTGRVQPEEVRVLVAKIFQQFGAVEDSDRDLMETALVDNGRCVARSYRLAGLMAMWFVEVGILQFYDAEGNMLQTVSLLNTQRRRLAA